MPPPSLLPEHCSVLWLSLVMQEYWDLSLAAELLKAGNSAKTWESETPVLTLLRRLAANTLSSTAALGDLPVRKRETLAGTVWAMKP